MHYRVAIELSLADTNHSIVRIIKCIAFTLPALQSTLPILITNIVLLPLERGERIGTIKRGGLLRISRLSSRRHDLDPRRHYAPTQLLALANGDTRRVAAVVSVALRRHREEMARGYALLSDHR